MGALGDLPEFLRKYRISKCLSHLEEHGITTLDSLKKISANNIKAIGFKPEVRQKLQKAIAGELQAAEETEEEEKYVTVEEEEEAIYDLNRASKNKKKKPKAKATDKKPAEAGERSSVPGEDGVALDSSFAQLLTNLGLAHLIQVFEENNITNLASCRYVTKEALVGSFKVPPEKAGFLLAKILQSIPGGIQQRRLPDLASDLSACVAAMRVTDALKEQVRASLKTNSVLTVSDAREKRFALMNEVGLNADAATELGRLLDAGPAAWQMPAPSNMSSQGARLPSPQNVQQMWGPRQMAR